MRTISMNNFTHEMVMILFDIQRVLITLTPIQQRGLLEELRDSSIETLAGRSSIFSNLSKIVSEEVLENSPFQFDLIEFINDKKE